MQVQNGWYKSLELRYVNGGAVPTDNSLHPLPMDGVIINPPVVSGEKAVQSSAFANGVIILPALPNESGFSPLVRLWDYTIPSTDAWGSLNDLCHSNSQTCTANQVDLDALQAAASSKQTNTILYIVTSAQ